MKPRPASKARLFAGIMYPEDVLYQKIISELVKKFGLIETESDEYDFTDFTDYYESEMGKEIKKRFVVFRNLINRDELADIKIWTNELEDKFSKAEKRRINLDPGYITLHNLVLGTMKDRAHKVYLGKGVYGDLTLLFKRDECIDFEWTFPDFKSKKVQEFFCKVRNQFKNI